MAINGTENGFKPSPKTDFDTENGTATVSKSGFETENGAENEMIVARLRDDIHALKEARDHFRSQAVEQSRLLRMLRQQLRRALA